MSTLNDSLLGQPFTRTRIVEMANQRKVDLVCVVAALFIVVYTTLSKKNVLNDLLKAVLRRSSNKLESFPLPPGPPSWPIFGYLSGLPRARAWEVYNEWSKTYGSDIIHVPTFGRRFIILNSVEAIFELLEQRGSIYSDRPHLVMLHDLMDLSQSTAFARYGADWRNHRKIYNQQMNINSVKKFRHYQSAAARDLLGVLLETPEEFAKHCRHFSAGIVMNIAYGYQIARENDEIVKLTEQTGRAFSEAAQPGFYMVDNFPILQHVPSFFPLTQFKTIATRTRELAYQSRTIPFRGAIQGMKAGVFKRCFVSDSLESVDVTEVTTTNSNQQASPADLSYADLKNDKSMEDFENREDVGLIKAIAGGIFGAGTTTTTSALQTFLLAMILYPSVQQKAQEELDAVLGGGRLPAFEDQSSLPYISALCQEVLRWFPVTPSALPHVTTEEDVYKGYRIPKGSVIIPNAWNSLHDPKVYPEPDKFKPERFLSDENGKIPARDPAVTGAFGFGRRICAGRNLAEASIWIAVASILAMFNIRPAIDAKSGEPIDVKDAMRGTPGLFNHPLPFKCRIEPRSEKVKKTILEACATA